MIDFLLNNIPLLIFIIGGILSLLGKKEEKRKTPKTEPVKTFSPKQIKQDENQGKIQQNEKPLEKYRREMEEKIKREVQKFVPPTNNESSSIQTVEVKEEVTEPVQSSVTNLQLQRELLNLEQQLEGMKEVKVSVPKITSEKLVEGIIWSEILGPPRAKKPYHPNYKS